MVNKIISDNLGFAPDDKIEGVKVIAAKSHFKMILMTTCTAAEGWFRHQTERQSINDVMNCFCQTLLLIKCEFFEICELFILKNPLACRKVITLTEQQVLLNIFSDLEVQNLAGKTKTGQSNNIGCK